VPSGFGNLRLKAVCGCILKFAALLGRRKRESGKAILITFVVSGITHGLASRRVINHLLLKQFSDSDEILTDLL